MALPMNYALPETYEARYEFAPSKAEGYTVANNRWEYKFENGSKVYESFQYGNADWHEQARKEVEARMISTVVQRLLSK